MVKAAAAGRAIATRGMAVATRRRADIVGCLVVWIMMDRKKEKGKRRKKKKVKKLAVKEKAAEIRQNISQMVGWLVCRGLGIWDLSVKIHEF